jgi:hypothetical protein
VTDPVIVRRLDVLDRHPRPRHAYMAEHREYPRIVGFGDTEAEARADLHAALCDVRSTQEDT